MLDQNVYSCFINVSPVNAELTYFAKTFKLNKLKTAHSGKEINDNIILIKFLNILFQVTY